MQVTKEQAIEILSEIAWLLELKGENRFKILAFENAGRVLEGQPADLKTLVESGELELLKGIGKGHIARLLHELYETGKCLEYEALKKEYPPTLFELFRIPGLGSKRIKILYQDLGIKSLAELQKACQENKLVEIKGLGQKIQDNILRGIEQVEKHTGQFLLSTALDEAQALADYLKKQSGVSRVEIAGSLRRWKETVHDVDILAVAQDHAAAHGAFVRYPLVASVSAQGDTKSSVILKSGLPCDLRTVGPEEFVPALYHLTGSKEHNVATRTIAKKHDIKINEYGIFKNERPLAVHEEADIFKALGLHFIPPELRENTGEIEWAAKKAIPALIEQKHIRGIFHVHTDYSDGTASLSRMVAQAQEMGFEYIGISDHSQSAKYAGGLEEERLRKQWKEIEKLQKTVKIRIFRGIESEILPDGRLDYPDSVLAEMDFVVGSIHSGFNLPVDKMTQRILRAMDNKYFTFLGHPTGRLLLQRPGYQIDLEAVLQAAKDKGIIMELNANPVRLDLDWHALRQAKEKGVLAAINPDAHTLNGFKDIVYGVGIARKAWLEKKDVINTLPLAQMEKFLL